MEDTWRLDAAPDGLKLVAIDQDTVVGHVLCATADLGGKTVVAIAPLAVSPDHQKKGIGSALMTEVVAQADKAGHPLIGLLGNPKYYGRFGFEAAGPHDIVYPPVGPDSPYFQVRRLAAYDDSYRGDFTYCWELTARP